MRMNVGTSGATGGPCIGALTDIMDGVMKLSLIHILEQEAPAGEVCLTPEAMDAYLDTLRQQGRSADTLAAYRRSIYGLYLSLIHI